MAETKKKVKVRDGSYTVSGDGICCSGCGCAHLLGEEADKRRICRNCGRSVRMQVIVAYECKYCESGNLKVTKTVRSVPVKRYILCLDCGKSQVRYGGK